MVVNAEHDSQFLLEKQRQHTQKGAGQSLPYLVY